MNLVEFNRLSDSHAQTELVRCCASHRWAQLMAAERPFANLDVMVAVGQRLWWSLAVADWLEAFAAHPRIGERATSTWPAQEQARAQDGGKEVRDRLAASNRTYEGRFGYTFIVSATGKTAEEILAILERRLHNEPGDELQVAADEQRKITILRLEKLITH